MRLPALAALTTAAIALMVPVSAHADSCPGSQTVPTSAATVAQAVDATLCLANQERAAAGAPALTLESGLSSAASAYAQRMVAEQFFAHVAPDGSTLIERLSAVGDHPDLAGENLYWGESQMATPAATIDGWMHSSEHRANLLDPEFRRVGLGIAIGAPKQVAGPAATVAAEFDSGSVPTAHPSSVTPRPPVATTGDHARARTPKAAVKAWFEAARLGNGPAFCLLEDNRLLKQQFGPGGRTACLAGFRPVAGLPAAVELKFSKIRTRTTRASLTVMIRGQRAAFVVRRFNGHWKLDSVAR